MLQTTQVTQHTAERSGLGNLDSRLSEIFTLFQAAVPKLGAWAVDCWWWQRMPLQRRHLRHNWHIAQVTSAIPGATYCTVTS